MAAWLGDFAEDTTVHFMWSSVGTDGASITRSTDGTVAVYKDNGTTESVAGVTDTEDFDSLTGIHVCTIDLSADAFYAVGANYSVVLQSATIDTVVVSAVLAHFSIENRTVDVREINSSATAAARLALAADSMIPGTVDTGSVAATVTSFEADDITEATASHFVGRVVIWTSGALLAQAVEITAYSLNGANGSFIVNTMTDTPGNNDTFIIV